MAKRSKSAKPRVEVKQEARSEKKSPYGNLHAAKGKDDTTEDDDLVWSVLVRLRRPSAA